MHEMNKAANENDGEAANENDGEAVNENDGEAAIMLLLLSEGKQ